MFQISKVTAVNRILQALDGTVISTLDQPTNSTVLRAIDALDRAVEMIQLENKWNFHMDGPRTLYTNDDGEIIIPNDFITVNLVNWSGGNTSNLATKGGKVWNSRTGTSVLTGTTVDIYGSRLFLFDDLDAVMQNYAIEYAILRHLGLDTFLSAARLAVYQGTFRKALMAAQKWDGQLQGGSMNIGPTLRNNLRNQNQGNRFWLGQ